MTIEALRQLLANACADLLAVKPRSELPDLMKFREKAGVLDTENQLKRAIAFIERETENAKTGV